MSRKHGNKRVMNNANYRPMRVVNLRQSPQRTVRQLWKRRPGQCRRTVQGSARNLRVSSAQGFCLNTFWRVLGESVLDKKIQTKNRASHFHSRRPIKRPDPKSNLKSRTFGRIRYVFQKAASFGRPFGPVAVRF